MRSRLNARAISYRHFSIHGGAVSCIDASQSASAFRRRTIISRGIPLDDPLVRHQQRTRLLIATAPPAAESTSVGQPPVTTYEQRRDRYAAERDSLTTRWNRIANLRLAAFVAAAVSIVAAIWQRSLPLAGLGALALAAFVALAVYHARLGRERRRAATLHDLNADALARLARDWATLPLRHTRPAPSDHPYAADLDLFGPASLLHLLDTTSTSFGQDTIAAWLLGPADLATIRDRQTAIAELAPNLDFRQELTARGRLRDEPTADPEPFLTWAESDRWLAVRPWALALGYVWPLLFWGALAGALLGLWPNRVWIAVFILNVGVGHVVGGAAHEVIERAISSGRAIQSYAAMLAWLTATPFTSDPLQQLQARLSVSSPSDRRPASSPAHFAAARLRRLSGLSSWVIPRDSPLYFPLQALTGWDVHLLAAFERWQAENGARVRTWLCTLGEAEALGALAGLAHDQPAWVTPQIDPALDAYTASDLGHPLLADGVRVTNDVTVGPPGTFLLVTGSNMSGKSTLLRAIGVNAVLAAAGGPVCARSLSLPPLRVWTSVRVEDSLARGVSFFMAELLRLKQVVDAADAAEPGAARLLYLLDEILQGTNTTERRIAARRIISHLVATGAIGAVSTHDLDLAAEPPLADTARAVHFREQVADGNLSFDYLARPGLATSTNALKLMGLVGLPTDEAPRGGR